MKTKLYLIILTLLMTTAVLAQAPEKFKYQGVVHDNNGNPFNDRIISLRISLLQEFVNGNAIYIEKHNTSTNKFGLFNINVGEGSVISGNFSTIPWSKYQYFQKVEIDTTGDTTGVGNFIFMGTSQLLSVPYALNAQTAENSLNNGFTHCVVYDTAGTYVFTFVDTHHQGMNYMVEVWGGGGGGGASLDTSINSWMSCGGGGGYGKTIIRVDSGDCYVTVGAGGLGNCMGSGSDGGTSSFGSGITLIYATGGHGGGADTLSGVSLGGTSNGPLNISGGYGTITVNFIGGPIWGGNSPNGGNGGVMGATSFGNGNGMAPGGGGCAWYDSNINSHAGNGANGRVVIYF
jgi:hypothetical protein